MVYCKHCRSVYPNHGAPFLCPECGGLYECDPWVYQEPDTNVLESPGIWRYRNSFNLPGSAPAISLGEGNTPLVWANAFGRNVAFKCEFQNPTGSFKDRGSATLVSFLAARQVSQVVEDSSGNAGASLAAYTARAGIHASIYVPGTTSGPKQKQIEAYGAEIVSVPGPRSAAAEQVRLAVREGTTYASHSYLPFNLPGYATIAYEIVEQLGTSPGMFLCPVGQGGLLLGAAYGFAAMQRAGIIQQRPLIIGVQAANCAPMVAYHRAGLSGLPVKCDSDTLAEGVRVRDPLRVTDVVQAVKESGGDFLAVAETDILIGRDELASRGFYVETTSAIVWNALGTIVKKLGTQQLPGPVVVVLTGSGLKTA